MKTRAQKKIKWSLIADTSSEPMQTWCEGTERKPFNLEFYTSKSVFKNKGEIMT